MLERTGNWTSRFAGALALATALTMGAAAGLNAQAVTFTFVGETAGDDVSMLLGDADLVFGLGELRPVIGLQSYVIMDEVTDASTMWVVTPSVGLRWAQPTGFLQAKVGYAWTDSDQIVPLFGGGESGVTTALHAEYWGDGRFGLQGIANHNWGADYLWTRARGTARVLPTGNGGVNVGVEGGWQGHTGSPEISYNATMIGPLVQWVTPNISAGLGAGWKNVGGSPAVDDLSTWYARVELVFSPW